MRNQPPHSNNPANPLFKVAALDLDKTYINLKPISRVRVDATLNFKRSNDMRGLAKTVAGEEITVTFSLGVRRATLELKIAFEDGGINNIDVQDIAYAVPLEAKEKVVLRTSSTSKSSQGLSLKGAGKVSLDLDGPSAGVSGAGKGEWARGSRTKSDENVSRSFNKNNISVTFGGNMIHWEFNSTLHLTTPHIVERPSFLEGEVFRSESGTKKEGACAVVWKPDGKKALVIHGAVFTLMQDLHVENIAFLTNEGEEVRWKDVDQTELAKADTPRNLFFISHSPTKERFLKQIIRKHLVAQGMTTEGARVQICNAYA